MAAMCSRRDSVQKMKPKKLYTGRLHLPLICGNVNGYSGKFQGQGRFFEDVCDFSAETVIKIKCDHFIAEILQLLVLRQDPMSLCLALDEDGALCPFLSRRIVWDARAQSELFRPRPGGIGKPIPPLIPPSGLAHIPRFWGSLG